MLLRSNYPLRNNGFELDSSLIQTWSWQFAIHNQAHLKGCLNAISVQMLIFIAMSEIF